MNKTRYISKKIIRGYPIGTVKTKMVWMNILEINDDGDFDFLVHNSVLMNNKVYKLLNN